MDEAQAGIKIARKNINNLKFADVIAVYLENPKYYLHKSAIRLRKFMKLARNKFCFMLTKNN